MTTRKLFILLILAAPLLILIPAISQFPFPPASPYSDLVITHFPNAVFVRNSLANWHEIPLWSNTILSGYPFAADPLSGLWYVPGWPAIILPIPLGFNLLVLFHLLLAGIGLFLFLRSEKMSTLPALAGAMSLVLMPKVFAHYAAGHVTLIYAFCWTPWLLLAEKRRIQSTTHDWIRVLPGIILGVILLADVRWAVYAGLLWACYSFFVFSNINGHFAWTIETIKKTGIWFLLLLFQVLIAILIALPLLLPFLEYIRFSTRNLLSPADVVTFSLTPAKLFGLIIPNFWGYAESVIYQGELSILILVFILTIPALRKKHIFWLSAVAAGLLLSLGSNIPIIRSFFLLPGMNLLRVPSRFLFIMGLSFSILLAAGLDHLIEMEGSKSIQKTTTLPIVAISGFVCFISIGVWITGGSLSLELTWGSIFLIIFSGLIIFRGNMKISAMVFLIAVIPLLVFDLAAVDISEVQYKPVPDVLSEQADVIGYLSTQPGLFRTYSPSYSMPQQIGALNNFQLADGIDPMQLQSYVDFMEKATGVPVNGYSVTLPAYSSGDPTHDNENYSPNFHLLGLLNVGFIISEFPFIELPPGTQAQKVGSSYIYPVVKHPRAWVQDPSSPVGESIISIPDLILRPNQIILEKVEGPGLLVLSEIYYPGWNVIVDDQVSEVKDVFNLFRGVNIPSGTHRVTFSFQPARVYIGLALAFLTWLILILYVFMSKAKKW